MHPVRCKFYSLNFVKELDSKKEEDIKNFVNYHSDIDGFYSKHFGESVNMYEDMSKTKFGDFIEILLHMPHRRDPEVDAGTYYKLSIDTVFIGTARVPKFKTMLHLPSALKDSSCLERFNKT